MGTSDATWLVPLTADADAEARSLDGRAGRRSLDGDRLAVLRGRGDSRPQLVVVTLDDGSEDEVWSGDGPDVVTWADEQIAVVGIAGATMVDPGSGATTEIVEDVELDPSTVSRTFGHLVGADGDEPRWDRLDDEGAEVDELRGFESLDVNPGGRRVLFGATSPAGVVAWNPALGATVALEGTGTPLEVLAEGVRNNVMSSPGGVS